MADNSSTQQLFELWKRQVEEGSQAWLKMMGQGQAVDPQAFWRPFMDQGMAAWSKVMTQGTPSPDLLTQWKQFVDQWIAAWAKALEQAMNTDTFAQALGRQLETFLAVAGPVKKAAEQQVEAGLAGLGMPSRSQVVALAKQIVQLEDKVDGVEEKLDAVRGQVAAFDRRLDDVVALLVQVANSLKKETA
ncbi:MAG TPA: poly(R)-hydroxyalkanoic acid synthase subunit PhaE [Methylomirabilota bacterium]|nr:poly(R)-hydroxyalkanoic acid synthase subunit PhaE [Methylomirabilota bacterium]